jgi:hypothetical protein
MIEKELKKINKSNVENAAETKRKKTSTERIGQVK